MNLYNKTFTKLLLSGLLIAPFSSTVLATEPADVRFSVPPWPGVTVKTQLASTLLDTLGYKTHQQEIGATITYQAMAQNELDVFLAAWLPAQQSMYDTATQGKDKIIDLGNNVDGARLGFVVPTYIYDAGYTSALDLCDVDFRKKAGGTIYSIEVGSGTSDLLADMQNNRNYCLDEWNLSETSTTTMFAQAKASMDRNEWIVFYAWTPHWASIEYDIQFLDDPEDAWGPDGGRSDVRTLVTQEFAESNPNATKLLDQLLFSAEDQSEMITGYSFKERPAKEVALNWMRSNPHKIKEFLDGVTDLNGQPAWPVVQKALQIPNS